MDTVSKSANNLYLVSSLGFLSNKAPKDSLIPSKNAIVKLDLSEKRLTHNYSKINKYY